MAEYICVGEIMLRLKSRSRWAVMRQVASSASDILRTFQPPAPARQFRFPNKKLCSQTRTRVQLPSPVHSPTADSSCVVAGSLSVEQGADILFSRCSFELVCLRCATAGR